MKRCIPCGAELDVDETTCPFCGESSWEPATVIVAVPEPVEAVAPVESKSVQRRLSALKRAKVVEE